MRASSGSTICPFRVPLGIVTGMSEARQPVIVGSARTPFGRLLGSLASKSASYLGGVSIAGALDRAGIGAPAMCGGGGQGEALLLRVRG